jgi:hypothetical protein
MEPSDYYDTPLNKVLHFIGSVGLIKDKPKQGKHNRSLKVTVKGLEWPTPYPFIPIHPTPHTSSWRGAN